eukprot:13261370-Alexandrium_andersonii.AAC.2
MSACTGQGIVANNLRWSQARNATCLRVTVAMPAQLKIEMLPCLPHHSSRWMVLRGIAARGTRSAIAHTVRLKV